VINNYIPMYICLAFVIISTILSFRFKEIYKENNGNKERISEFIKGYSSNMGDVFIFIKKSNRMKSYLIFATVFYGLVKVVSTYKSDLLINMEVSEEQFSIIYAVLSLIAAVSVTFTRKIQRQFKNKTLTFLSLSYIISTILIGIIVIKLTNNIALPLILIFYIVTRICDSQWWVTEYTYLRNFTTPESRNKITFTYELITGIGASIISVVGAVILDYVSIKYAVLLIGLLFLAIMIVILDYMRKRFGLKPELYKKEDIEFMQEEEN